ESGTRRAGHSGAGDASLTAVTQPPPPPGWYPDPAGTPGTRWWDGQGWTDHVQQAAPPPPPPAAPPPSVPPPPPVQAPPVPPRPAKVVKSRVLVERPDGTPIGEIVQANVFGKIRFDLVAGGQLVGAIQAENWRAWDFAIVDAAGTEVARITKKWEGLARTLFTTADRYVVLVHYRLPEPLASMVIASALTVD